MLISYVVKNDKFENIKDVLKGHFMISDRLLLKLKNNNKIFLNKVPCNVKDKVNLNDTISFSLDFVEDNSNIVATKMNLDIIYEDEYYLVLNKPAGIAVHPSILHYDNSLSNGVKYYFDSINLKKKIRPVNRIDKDTSGLVVFAKNEYIQECLSKQMNLKQFNKEYIAIVEGFVEEPKGTIDLPIARKENSIIERCISPNGDKSITHYEILREGHINDTNFSVVKCILETGRTHQIRVHFSSIGHPLLSDTLYGNSSSLISRQALHSFQMKFVHPITNKNVKYIAKIPEDFYIFLNNTFL